MVLAGNVIKNVSQVGFLGTHNIVKSEIFGMTSFVLFLDVYNVNVVIFIKKKPIWSSGLDLGVLSMR